MTGFYADEEDVEILNEDSHAIQLDERYRVLVDTRKFEIENFSKRSSFTLGILVLVSGFFFSDEASPEGRLIAALVAAFLSISFSLMTRGAKFWQSVWERRVELFESKAGFSLFSYDVDTSAFQHFRWKDIPFWVVRFSPSRITIMIADMFTLLWVALLGLEIARATGTGKLSNVWCGLKAGCEIDGFSTVFWLFLVVTLMLAGMTILSMVFHHSRRHTVGASVGDDDEMV